MSSVPPLDRIEVGVIVERRKAKSQWIAADPAEGESWTQAGSDLVETVPMPALIREAITAFIADHHVERPFAKRRRDRSDPKMLARRGPLKNNEADG